MPQPIKCYLHLKRARCRNDTDALPAQSEAVSIEFREPLEPASRVNFPFDISKEPA